ncbi:MAG: hypothetical protein E6J90_09480 [Deltaproteobacteria bacterium]|nr:MAG: hypothetical protein E6J90_09480 [Deltaproteobacteria bacterium]
MTPEAQRLDLLAATQIIADGEVAHCWELVRVGIQMLFIGTGNLGELIGHLRAGNGMTLDELTIEVEPPGSDRLLVAILDDQRACSAPEMIGELERLAGRAGAASPADGRPTSGGTPTGTPPNTRAGGAESPDLLGLLAGLLGTTPDRLAGDPTAYRAQVERVRAAAARWREVISDPNSDAAARDSAEAELRALLATTGEYATATAARRTEDLEAAMQALGVDPNRIAGALRTIADWLERTPTAGAAVDRMIAALDAAAAPFLGRLTPAAADAERDQRVRESARAAIASRIKLPPS